LGACFLVFLYVPWVSPNFTRFSRFKETPDQKENRFRIWGAGNVVNKAQNNETKSRLISESFVEGNIFKTDCGFLPGNKTPEVEKFLVESLLLGCC